MTNNPETEAPRNHLAFPLDGRVVAHLGRHIICQGSDGLQHEGWLARVSATVHIDPPSNPLLCEAPVSTERVEYLLTLDTDPGRSQTLDGVTLRSGVIYGVDVLGPTLARVLDIRRDEDIKNATPNDPARPTSHWWSGLGDV